MDLFLKNSLLDQNFTNSSVINQSLERFHEWILTFSGKENTRKPEIKVQLIKSVKVFNKYINQYPNQCQEYSDRILAVLTLLVAPLTDIEVRFSAWKTAAHLLVYNMDLDYLSFSWPHFLHSSFILQNEEGHLPEVKIGTVYSATTETFSNQCQNLIDIITPKLNKENLKKWWYFLGCLLFPVLFEGNRSKDRGFKETICIIFLTHITQFISVEDGISPFNLSFANNSFLNYTYNIFHSVSSKSVLYTESMMFIQKCFPFRIWCTKSFDFVQNPKRSSMREEILQSIPLLLNSGVKLSELLSWFDSEVMPPATIMIENLSTSLNDCHVLFLNLITASFYIVKPLFLVFREKFLAKENYLIYLASCFEQMLSVRALLKAAFKTSAYEQLHTQVPVFFLTLDSNEMLPFMVCSFFSVLFDSKNVPIQTIRKNMVTIKKQIDNSKFRYIGFSTQLFLQLSSQIACTLAPVISNGLIDIPEMAINPVHYEKSIHNPTLVYFCKENNKDLIEFPFLFFYSLSPNGWEQKSASSFIFSLISSFDDICDFLLSPSIIDTLASFFPNSGFPYTCIQCLLLDHMLSVSSLVPKISIPPFFSALNKLVVQATENSQMNTIRYKQWIVTLAMFIERFPPSYITSVLSTSLGMFFNSSQLIFSLVPIIVFAPPKKDCLGMLDINVLESLLSFLTTVAMIKSNWNQKSISSFYQCLNLTIIQNEISALINGSIDLRGYVLQLILFITQSKTAPLSSVSIYIFILFIEGILGPYPLDIQLISLINVVLDNMSSVGTVFIQLLSILPNYYLEITQKWPQFFPSLRKKCLNIINSVPSCDLETFEYMIKLSTDIVLQTQDKDQDLYWISDFIGRSEVDEEKENILTKETDYILENSNKQSGVIKPSPDHRIMICGEETYPIIFSKFTPESIFISAANVYGSSSYAVKSQNMLSSTNPHVDGPVDINLLPSHSASLFFHINASMSGRPLASALTTQPPLASYFAKTQRSKVNPFVFFNHDSNDEKSFSKLFISFMESMGTFVDPKTIKTAPLLIDGLPTVFWENSRYEIRYQIVPFSRSFHSFNRVAIVWWEKSCDVLMNDYYKAFKVLIMIKPIRNSMFQIRIRKLINASFGPIQQQAIVPKHMLSVLIQWTVVFADLAIEKTIKKRSFSV